MAITFSIQDLDFSLTEESKLRKWISKVISLRRKSVGIISYLFCNDNFVLRANQSFLNHDTYTDIITFDYVKGDVIYGDIMISVDRVRENAVAFNVPFEQELKRVIIHGILHLLGQGDKTDVEAMQMRNLENEALELWKTMD